MFIETEATPNPATLKFLPGREVLGDQTANLTSPEAAECSPLAKALFGLDGVEGVFLGRDFISVTLRDGNWLETKPLVLGVLMEHFVADLPLLTGEVKEASVEGEAEGLSPEEAEIVTQICELLDTRVRPAVAQDGGDIVYHGYKSGTVYLHMQGACAGCPSSTATLKHGIENLLRHYIPEIESVEAV